MGTNYAPLVADLFLFCYERFHDFSLSDDNQADIIVAFNSTSRFIIDRSNAVALLWFSVTCFWCQNFGDVSPYTCSYYF